MPLYICNDPYGYGASVEMDMWALTGQDSAFSDKNPDINKQLPASICQTGEVLITYNPPAPQTAGAGLVAALAQNTPSVNIVVYGMDAADPLPGGWYLK